ncbi:NACHT domain-containing protein [Streptomyces sp. SAS_270]|uniref:NACHT domain-containing protein n=1 Tax=Streptomyces sp. SAS_270 TaxID=3412748 RepID=UPI00403C83A6
MSLHAGDVVGLNLALDGASIITAVSGLLVAAIAAAVALLQIRRTQHLEREKIQLQLAADLRLKEQEWAHERLLSERERRRADQVREVEREQAAEELEAQRGSLEARAAAYCVRLVHELSTLRILDMPRPLRLDHLYVHVRVQEQQPLRYVHDDELVERVLQNDASLGDSPHADAEAANYTYEPVGALQRYQRIVVVGDPGAGKTTMLRHLALRMARHTGSEALPELPAYIELFRFVESSHDSLLDYLVEHWTDQYGFENPREYVEEKLADGRAALLLDGLDEVLGGESAQDATDAYNRVAEELARLATRFPQALIAVTCRRHGWRGGLPQFQVLEALDFEWPQIEKFIANWFGEQNRRRGGLVRALSGNARLRTLAANPLLLSLIAIVYERDLELPERRAALYQRCVEVLLREWDAHRKITRYSRFTTDRKRDLLKEIAWQYHQRGLRYIPEDDLLDSIARFLPTIDLSSTDSLAILEEIVAQYGLLKPQAHGWYGFLHLTLQEHFAAAALLERGEAGVRQAVEARYDPWWEEVILLLAGLLPDATPLLSGLLQLEPGRSRTQGIAVEPLRLQYDDLFHTDLLLAARCLAGSPRVADVGLRQQIMCTVWKLLETSPWREEKQRSAEAIVGVLGSDQQLNEVIAFIRDERQDMEARVALIDSLSTHGGRNVGERLLGLLALQRRVSNYENSYLLRNALIQAVGILHVEAAVPKLREELDELLSSLNEGIESPYQLAGMAAPIIRALGQAGVPADVFLNVLEVWGESADFGTIALAARDALSEVRDPLVAERLLQLVTRDNRWTHERTTLASVYLSVAGDAGTGTLLELLRFGGMPGRLTAPMMTALQGHLAKGYSRAYRDALVELAHDDGTPWQVRWLALECLSPSPGTVDELMTLIEHPDIRVSVAAAATLAAWGAPIGLNVIRTGILSGLLPPDLWYARDQGGYAERGRIAQRLAAVLSPYGVSDLIEHFCTIARGPEEMTHDAFTWLRALDPEAEVDIHLDRLGSGDTLSRYDLPDQIPLSRIHTVLQYFLDTPPERSHRAYYGTLLRAAANLARDQESVAQLLRLIPESNASRAHFPEAFNWAYEASRRARVRVLPGHTIVPLI